MPDVLDAVRVRAALRPDTLLSARELALVVPEGLLDWVLAQVDPCSVVEESDLYEWSDVRAMLADPPRPKTVTANKKRRSRNNLGEKRGHLTVIEAAAELGISDRTLRKRLLDEEVHLILGGPVDTGTGKYKHWRFPSSTLQAWWRQVNEKAEPRAKTRRRRRSNTRRPPKVAKPIDWAAAARGDLSR